MDKRRAPRTGDRNLDLALEELWREVQDVRNSQAQLKVVKEDKNRHRLELQTRDGKGSARIQVDDGQFAERMTRDLDLSGYSIKNAKDIQTDSVSASKGSVYLGRDTHMYADGEKVLISSPKTTGHVGMYPVMYDIKYPATAINPHGGVSAPDWDSVELGWLFSGTATEELEIVAQLPHGISLTSPIKICFTWETVTSSAGQDVVWQIEYKWKNLGEAVSSFAFINLVEEVLPMRDKLKKSKTNEIYKTDTGDAIQEGSVISFFLRRLGGHSHDTYNSDVRLKQVNIHAYLDDPGIYSEG